MQNAAEYLAGGGAYLSTLDTARGCGILIGAGGAFCEAASNGVPCVPSCSAGYMYSGTNPVCILKMWMPSTITCQGYLS